MPPYPDLQSVFLQIRCVPVRLFLSLTQLLKAVNRKSLDKKVYYAYNTVVKCISGITQFEGCDKCGFL